LLLHLTGDTDETSEGRFVTSTARHENGSEAVHSIRTSTSAHLDDYDPIVNCLSKRVSEFQGYHPEFEMESFQVTRYEKKQQYGEHYDWFSSKSTPYKDGANRLTTFFGILEAECENCGTRFPKVRVDWKKESKKWCDIVDW
jgi:prolyl 4-hydroxylase